MIEPVSSEPTLLVLHAVRLLGFADEGRVAARFALDRGEAVESLEDFEALGWVQRSRFAGTGGWSMTDAGRARNSAQLAAELDAAGAQPVVAATLEAFEPLNARFLDAVTRWQLHPMPGDPLAANDHSDPRWDDRVIADLVGLGSAVDRVCAPLAAALARFNGYAARYATSADRVRRGEARWASTPVTWCGSSCTRTCSLPWAWTGLTDEGCLRCRSRSARCQSPDPAARRPTAPAPQVRVRGCRR